MASQQHIWATHLIHWSKYNGQISSLPPISSKISIPIFENKTHLSLSRCFSKWSKTLTLSRPVKNQIRPKPTLQSASKHLTDFARSSSPHSRDQCFGPQRSCTRNAQEPETLLHKEQKGAFNPSRIKKSWNAWASMLGQKTKTQKFKKLIPKKWWFRTHQHWLFTGIYNCLYNDSDRGLSLKECDLEFWYWSGVDLPVDSCRIGWSIAYFTKD